MAVVQTAPEPRPPPALWVLSFLALVLMLCALCTTCHRWEWWWKSVVTWGLAHWKGKRRQQSGLKLVDVSLLRQTQLRSLSKSDSKLHEFNRGPRNCKAQRPTSIDLLYPRWPGGTRADVQMATVPPVFIHRELPQPPLASDSWTLESTYSNVSLAAAPRAPPMTQRGEEQLRISEKLVVAEYACIRKNKKGAEVGPSITGPSDSIPGERGAPKPGEAAEVEVLYSKISRPGRKPLEPTWNRAVCNQLDRNTQAPLVETANEGSQSPATDPTYRTSSPFWGRDTGNGPMENFYESISEMEGLGEARIHKPSEDL